jgi:hypothetical protein
VKANRTVSFAIVNKREAWPLRSVSVEPFQQPALLLVRVDPDDLQIFETLAQWVRTKL